MGVEDKLEEKVGCEDIAIQVKKGIGAVNTGHCNI